MNRNFLFTVLITGILNLCSCKSEFFNPRPDLVCLEEIEPDNLNDGIYTGLYTIGPVKVITRVTVTDHIIKDIKIIKHRTGQGQAAEQIIEEVIKKQSVCLDAISGATISSKCILKSIETALNN
ncbi:MAG: FMN-binding protein [Bacteroidales bacterium]|nr:FMN-binding protein [Bacteroidales bacterium]